MQIPQIYFVFNCAHAVSNTWSWGSWDLLFFPLLCIHKDSSSEEDERLTPSFSLLKELSEKWTPFFYLPGSKENFSESKENVFRKCMYSTVDIQFPGVHRAPETHFWTPASEELSLLMFSTSRAEVGKLQSTRQSQLMACFVHKILLEHRRSLTYHLWLLSCHGAGLSSCHRDQRVWTASKTFTIWPCTEKVFHSPSPHITLPSVHEVIQSLKLSTELLCWVFL